MLFLSRWSWWLWEMRTFGFLTAPLNSSMVNAGGGLPLGEEDPVRKNRVREPVLFIQTDEEGIVSDPGDEIALLLADAFGEAGNPIRLELFRLFGVRSLGTELPSDQRPDTFILHGQPGVEKAAVLEMGVVKKGRILLFNGPLPLGLVKRGRMKAGGEDDQQEHKSDLPETSAKLLTWIAHRVVFQ